MSTGMRQLLAVLFLLSVSSQVQAQFFTGNDLHTHCTRPGYFADGFCFGYVTSAYDSMMLDRFTCPKSRGVSAQQLVDVVKQFLQKNPAVRNQAASGLVRVAIGEAFDCTLRP